MQNILLGGLGRMRRWRVQWRSKAARHVRDLELAGCDAATLAYVQASKSSAECPTTLEALRASHEPGCKVLMGHRIASLVVPARVK